jgi:hypothetical protein
VDIGEIVREVEVIPEAEPDRAPLVEAEPDRAPRACEPDPVAEPAERLIA